MSHFVDLDAKDRLTGLSLEQLGIYHLKTFVDCSAWWKKAVGLEEDEFLCLFSSAMESFRRATQIIEDFSVSSQPGKSIDFLQILQSSSLAVNYLRLLAVISDQFSVFVSTSSHTTPINQMLRCLDICFSSLKSSTHGDRLIEEILECLEVLLAVSARAFSKDKLSGNQLVWLIRCTTHFTEHAIPFLASYSNKKKLYVAFCQKSLGSCAQIVHECSSRTSDEHLEAFQPLVNTIDKLLSTSLLVDDKYVEDLAMSTVGSANLATISVDREQQLPHIFMQQSLPENESANGTSPVPAKSSKKSKNERGDTKKEVGANNITVKVSFYSGLYDAISNVFATTSSVVKGQSNYNRTASSLGIGGGVAQLLRVYASSSDRVLNVSSKGPAATSSGAAHSSTTTLADRRKHAIRILQVAFSINSALESAYAKTVNELLVAKPTTATTQPSTSDADSLLKLSSKSSAKKTPQKAKSSSSSSNSDETDEITTATRGKLTYALVCFVNTKKALYESLSQCLDEAGGTAALATHDSLRGYASRLHLTCGRSLRNILDEESLTAFLAKGGNNDGGGIELVSVRGLLTEALKAELDCVRVIAGIDHRAITLISSNFLPTTVQSLEGSGLVFRALVHAGLLPPSNSSSSRSAGVPVAADAYADGDGEAEHRLLSAKVSLLLAVVRLYADLRAMHEFVKLVLNVADEADISHSHSHCSLVALLQTSQVDSLLIKELAALPNSQLELVWEAAAGITEGANDGEKKVGVESSNSNKSSQGFAARALVVRSLVISAAVTSAGGDSEGGTQQSLQISASSGLSSLSLAAALPDKSVHSMSALLKKAVEALELTSSCGDAHGDDRHVAVSSSSVSAAAHAVICSLLQLASAAIVLAPIAVSKSKDGEEIKVDIWLDFRKEAGKLAAQHCIQHPASDNGGGSGGQGKDTLLACGSLLALSSFVSTCSAMMFSMSDSVQSSDDTSASELCTALDGYVYRMLTNLCGYNRDSSATSITAVTKKQQPAAKRKREASSGLSSVSVSPADASLLVFRSVAVWSHLNLPVDAVAALLAKHIEAVANGDDENLLAKHAALCDLMRTPLVLDTPVLLKGCLRVIVDLLDTAPRGGSSTGVLTTLLQLPVDSLLDAAAEMKGIETEALPQLTTAAAEALITLAEKGSAGIDDKSVVDLVAKLLLACLQSRTRRGLLSRSYIAGILRRGGGDHKKESSSSSPSSSPAEKGGEEDALWRSVDLKLLALFQSLATGTATAESDLLGRAETSKPLFSALQALVDVLLCSPFCGVNSPVTSGSDSSAVIAPESKKRKSNAHTETHLNDQHQHAVLGSIVTMIQSRLSPEENKATASRTPRKPRSASVTTASVQTGSKTVIELLHRVSAFYCSASAELESSPGASFDDASSVLRGLLDQVDSRLQLPSEQHTGAVISWDQCCHVAADCLRTLARLHSVQAISSGSEVLKLDVIPLPRLAAAHIKSREASVASLDGWFLLAGTIFILQAQQGLKLSVRASLAVVNELKEAIYLAAYSLARGSRGAETEDGKAIDRSLSSLSVCLEGILMCTPAITKNAIGEMFVQIMEDVVNASSNLVGDSSRGSHGESCQQLSAVLARFAIAGADCVLQFAGNGDGDAEFASDGSTPMTCAKSILELATTYTISSGNMLEEASLLSSIVPNLRKGVQRIQQKQQRRGRRRVDKGADDDDDIAGFNKEMSLSSWAGCCLSVLSKIVPRLSQHFEQTSKKTFQPEKGRLLHSSNSSAVAVERTSVEISMHALATLDILFSSDSTGGSSLTILGNSVGCIGGILATAIRVIVAADEAVDDGSYKSGSEADAEFGLFVCDALRIASRALSAASSSKELLRHANFLAVAVVELLAQRPLTANTRQLLLPGVFALFDKCRQRQRQQMFNTSTLQTRAVLSELHGTYLRDYKFTGKA